MHIHAAQASALGNALAGAQDSETAVSMRRARELRDAATRLKAASLEIHTQIPEHDPNQDQETAAQTISMVTAWSGGQPSRQPSPQSSAVLSPIQEVQRTPPSNPVSYWA
ncbi:MAG TPA: hypothetical protein VHZ52_18865 [Acidobacteriaceae bacterium]|jgi:hypothetical protein|nr:hypothetical protein [Acidobacteriaceae bacterium]